MKNKIKKLKNSLKWPVKIEKHGGVCEIITDAKLKTHVIRLPSDDCPDAPREIEYLHELCHASLAEKVHPLFSGAAFVHGTSQNFCDFYAPLFRSVSDWFADELLFSIAPEDEKNEIREHVGYITDHLKKNQNGNLEILFGAAFIFAQSERYLGEKIETGGQLKTAIDNFFKISPENPTIEKLQTLLNLQFEAINAEWRIELVIDNGEQVWKFKKKGQND